MDERTPLSSSTASYYGKNDMRPLTSGKILCYSVLAILLSPIWVPLLLLWAVLAITIMCCLQGRVSAGQLGMMKVKTFDIWWYKAPGKRLETRSVDKETTDMIISKDFVDGQGNMSSCGGCGISLRKSIECTVDAHIRAGPYGAAVAEDTDVNKPRYHLHAQIYPWDPSKFDELWSNTARFCHWPSVYCWTSYIQEGMFRNWTEKIPVEPLPEVLGYTMLLEVSNPNFFDGDSRMLRVGQEAAFCPAITPENEGKVFMRYNYRDAHYFGNLPTDGSEPDAYIFKGKTLEQAQLKVLHTYRLLKPETGGGGEVALAEKA